MLEQFLNDLRYKEQRVLICNLFIIIRVSLT